MNIGIICHYNAKDHDLTFKQSPTMYIMLMCPLLCLLVVCSGDISSWGRINLVLPGVFEWLGLDHKVNGTSCFLSSLLASGGAVLVSKQKHGNCSANWIGYIRPGESLRYRRWANLRVPLDEFSGGFLIRYPPLFTETEYQLSRVQGHVLEVGEIYSLSHYRSLSPQ